MAKQENEGKKKRNALDRFFINLMKGRIMPYHFFRRHWIAVIAIVSMILMSIAAKYDCQSKISEIVKLKKELDVEISYYVLASSKYNSMIRERSMKDLVDTMRIELISPDCPPFNIADFANK
ncbi:MAG: FtsL-like putative cell division protein [Muribaculaceae bacterium]